MLLVSEQASPNSTIESKSYAPLHRLEPPKEGAPADPECNSGFTREEIPRALDWSRKFPYYNEISW